MNTTARGRSAAPTVFQPPVHAGASNVAERAAETPPPPAQPPGPAEAVQAPAPRATLMQQLRAIDERLAENEAAQAAQRGTLAAYSQQDAQLATRYAETDAQRETRRQEAARAMLDGTPAPAGTGELSEALEAITGARRALAAKVGQVELELQRLGRVGAEIVGQAADLRFRIALARYARLIRDAIPQAQAMVENGSHYGRPMHLGNRLMIDPRTDDINGIPLATALAEAENLGD